MFPPKGSGLEQIKKALEVQYPGMTHARPLEWPISQNPMDSLKKLQNSVQNVANGLTKNITNIISQITKTSPQEDYEAIMSGFTPPGTRLLTPEYPMGSETVLRTDLDGDSENELIASYMNNDGTLRTIILKKFSDSWSRLTEISNSKSIGIHYINTVDLKGSGRKQLLLGLASDKKHRMLHGYSFEKDGFKELFSQHYNKLEVLGLGKAGMTGKSRIALWNANDDETYDIELLGLNGTQLVRLNNEDYYFKKVLPYYVNSLKRKPNDIHNWLLLADALEKAGAKKDARTVIDYGRKHDRNLEYKERFQNLISRL